ncbi:patched domain-containing protein 3-like isoform X1 [Macrobrachium rosenbergii]|uniref:patched domain-containing protein 3-like isoform X1 n=2 Tax=Macrobrachium rosenbergii TaxID=79674 RepID=UPI0034D5268D
MGNDGNCMTRVSEAVVNSLENFFYRFGRIAASFPWAFIAGSLIATGLACLGFLNFYVERKPERLWIPQGSDYVKTIDWQEKNFPQDQRVQMIIFEAKDNVLTADYIREMFRVHQDIRATTTVDGNGRTITQEDVCYRVPALGGEQRKELNNIRSQLFPGRSFESNEFDWSLALDKEIYYQFYAKMPTACLEISILEMWGYNSSVYERLTDRDVTDAVNTAKMAATFSYPMNFTEFLGGVTRNGSGYVTAAKAAIAYLVMRVNRSEVTLGESASHAGLSEEVDTGLYNWEGAYIQLLLNQSDLLPGLKLFPESQRSFGEISGDTIFGDVIYLVFGEATLFIYVQLMLGKFNMVENRPLLSLLGIFSTFMAVGLSFGLCSAFSLPYGPVHSILPLLMLGLGVDDMFVIVQCFSNLNQEERRLELKQRMATALRHAGVAITVTSITDFGAFFIGATTVLPALRSFCIYSAVGIASLYALQLAFFFPWFALDQRRLEDGRNGLIWCYKHKNWTPNECSQHDFCQSFFENIYSRIILLKPVKVLVLLLTAALFGVCAWGVSGLRQEFNPIWFIPQSSYLFQFLDRIYTYYPSAGERGTVYLGALDYPREVYKVGQLTEAMLEDEYISHVDSWYDAMANYTMSDLGEDIRNKPLNDTFFSQILSAFLFSPVGSKYQSYFHFDGNLTIARPTPPVLACKFDYRHRSLDGPGEQIPAMDQVKQIVKDMGFSDFAAPIAFQYSSWETDKVIFGELIRNLSLAMVAVLIMTLILLANIVASIYVLICVAMTLLDVMALMTWWGLTVDIITCINLVLCIGLCVDYSAHIALHFLQVKGDRNERVRQSVRDMGPPVINGAFSTFLAFVLLANSDSHVFLSFFKIFFGVFIFGVYHGLVFLPVLLSLVGPPPYSTSHAVSADSGAPHAEQEPLGSLSFSQSTRARERVEVEEHVYMAVSQDGETAK